MTATIDRSVRGDARIGFWSSAWIVMWRGWVKTQRMPSIVVQSVFFPTFFLIVYSGLYDAVTDLPGFPTNDVTNWFLPFMLFQGAAFGGLGAGFGTAVDIDNGFFDRLLLMPGNRLAIMVGSVGFALLRSLMVAVVVAGVGTPVEANDVAITTGTLTSVGSDPYVIYDVADFTASVNQIVFVEMTAEAPAGGPDGALGQIFWSTEGDEATGMQPGDIWLPVATIAGLGIILHLFFSAIGPQPSLFFGSFQVHPLELPALVLLCYLWYRIIRSYRDLNSAKFKVIHAIEHQLPLRVANGKLAGNGVMHDMVANLRIRVLEERQ